MVSLGRKKTIILLIIVCLISVRCFTVVAFDAKQNQSRKTVSVASQSKIKSLMPKILTNYKRIKYTNFEAETDLGEYKGEKFAILNSKSKSILKSFNVNYENIKNVKIIRDNMLDKILYRANIDNAVVNFDKNGDISEYRNNDDMSDADKNKINSAKDLNPIISCLASVIDLQGYKKVDCSNLVGSWMIDWNKDLGNGITNPYDVVVVSINAKDGSVWIYNRNIVTPNTTVPIVTKNQAIKFAQPIINKFKNTKNIKVSLTVSMPNFYWEKGGPYRRADFARLAWKVSLDSGASIMVDAQTGEILGGDQLE